MRTTTYRAPDKARGYTAAEVAAILSKHPHGTLVVRVGWKGQPQQIIVTDPDLDEQQLAYERQLDDHEAGCRIGPPPLPGNHRADQRLGEHGARGMVTFPGPINVVPSPSDLADIEGIARATEAEELVREELHAAGIDVAAVENAVRRAQGRTSGGTR